MPRRIAFAASVTVPHAPEELWPFVANTDRMDRAVGLPPAHFTRLQRVEGGEEHLGEYRLLGRTLVRWIEHPFEWEWPQRYAVVREYQRGPLVRYYGGAELVPTGTGTRIRVFSEFTPRRRGFAPLVRFGIGPITIRRACRQYRAIAAYLTGRLASPFPTLARQRAQADVVRLDAQIAQLRAEGAPSLPTLALRRLLAEAADEDVAGMRPLELAARWGLDPRQTLETFLRATLVGLLVVRWELLCPGCRGVRAKAAHLRDLAASNRCPACNLHVVADIDEAIEARFYPDPAIRSAEVGTYCVGGPMNTPHRLAHRPLPPGASHEWHLDLAAGRYVFRSPQSGASADLLVECASGADRAAVAITATALEPATLAVRAGRVAIGATNTLPHPATIALDDARWAQHGTTPSKLLTLPAFHAFFSAEALAPGVELAIGRVGLLFTDLAGSTALYERAGDARAFRLVGEHFALLQAAIEAAGGALVKTIGDAVMASFPDGRTALLAALAIQRDIRRLDTQGLAAPATLVKVGVHAGACYAVTLNERLDYFGTAVNLAARAQREAAGGEIVATAAAFGEDGASLVADRGLRGEPLAVSVKGLRTPVQLYRIACQGLAGRSVAR
jgi:adenylate cyclase